MTYLAGFVFALFGAGAILLAVSYLQEFVLRPRAAVLKADWWGILLIVFALSLAGLTFWAAFYQRQDGALAGLFVAGIAVVVYLVRRNWSRVVKPKRASVYSQEPKT